MSLGQVRGKINQVDDDMKHLFDERMECSNQVAAIKIAENDKVFKPLREKEIAERFSGDEEYLAFIKKIMQISRKRQYGIFFDKVKSVSEGLLGVKSSILERGVLELKLKSDNTQVEGLGVNDILSIIADSSLRIRTLSVSEDGSVDVQLDVDEQDKSIKEALVLSYMMKEETI